MKLINRTDQTKHCMPMNPWPRWCFNLWCFGAGDLYAVGDPDYEKDFDVPHWRMVFWSIRGNVLMVLFGWWRYV